MFMTQIFFGNWLFTYLWPADVLLSESSQCERRLDWRLMVFVLWKLSCIERVIEITQITLLLMGMIDQLFSLRQHFFKETCDLLTYGLLIYSYRSSNDLRIQKLTSTTSRNN